MSGTTHSVSFGFTTLAAGGTPGEITTDNETIPQILTGSGAPTITAPQGSLYLRSDGGLYVNADGADSWTQAGTEALPQALDVTDSPTFDALTLTTGPLAVGAASLSATELGWLDGVTPGTAAASKALVLSAGLAISTITSATITTLTSTTVNRTNGAVAGYEEYTEIADPAAPAVNKCRLYTRDNGGKTQLVAVFNSGAVQQVAIEP